MDLESVLKGITIRHSHGDLKTPITGLTYDSRKVKAGDLFVALRGDRFDGHEFIPQAIASGASALLVETPLNDSSFTWAQVDNAREALWRVAQNFYDDPTAHFPLVGVTGTNGKTTTTYLLRSILKGAGKTTALVGTLGAMIDDELIPINHTTPEAPDLMELFALARSQGAKSGVMEVSSHGIALRRVQGCRFDVGVFTNLTQDHLDFHATMENYALAKEQLFTEIAELSEKPFNGVINIDDHFGERYAAATKGKVLTYGMNERADIRAVNPTVGVRQISYRLITPQGEADLLVSVGGRFNIWNSLAAVGAALALEIPLDIIVKSLSGATGAPGRFETVFIDRDFDVLVDYAHTPDALEKLLQTARELNPQRLVVIFGCGGNRDVTKRPKMGKIAAELSDRCIITSDNPRKEDPELIIADILPGIGGNEMRHTEIEPDRKKAIHLALETAKAGDLIVIAGKGHEDYQIIGETKYPFDDRLIVSEFLGVEQ